jgi:hypothetical protein
MKKQTRFNLTKKIVSRDPIIEEIYQWLNEYVGVQTTIPQLTLGHDYVGSGWRITISPMAHGKFKPQYYLEFTDSNQALLFKLRWSASI